jgi:hypothetical protein
MKKMIIVAAMLITTLANAQTDIKINVKKGFTMHATNDVVFVMDMMGMVVDVKTINYVTATVDNVNDKNETEWTFVLDSMILDSKQGDEVSYMNSNDKKSMKDAPKEITDNIGKKIKVVVDGYGRVTLDKADEVAGAYIKSCFIEYAGQAITDKQNWKIENDMNMMGKSIDMITTYIIKASDKNTYTVEANSAAKIPMLGEIPLKSSFIVDAATGIIISSSTSLEMNKMGAIKSTITYNSFW